MSKIATIGFFDGVHRGHRFLFEQLLQIGQTKGLQPMVVTFQQHPRSVLSGAYPPQLITSSDERIALIEEVSGVTPVVMDFAAVQSLTAAAFMQLLHREYGVTALLMGYDHRFGSDGLRRPEDYQHVGKEAGMEVITLPEYAETAQHVSSTEIRHALAIGDIAQVQLLLGRPYSLSGVVEHGNAIGRTIGFPTANIRPDDPEKIIPLSGVYQVDVLIDDSTNPLQGLLNIGTNPTVGNDHLTVELHILNYQGDLYNHHITLFFVRRIREERTFDSLDTLRTQILADIKSCQQ